VIRDALRLWRTRDAGILILLYHRVAQLTTDRWSIAVSPAHFTEHMELLGRRAAVIRLADVDAMRSRRRRRNAVVVTFDDGYVDNLSEALPVLRRHGVPATLFAVTDAVLGEREFWWDELQRLVPRESYDERWGELRDAEPAVREERLRALRTLAGQGDAPRDAGRPLTRDELATLSADPLIDVGGHTASHPRLAALSAAAQRREIEEGKRVLESIVEDRITSFAYPFGRMADYTADTMQIVRDAGFARACSNQAGRVDRSTNPFALPRLFVRDWDGDEFAAALRHHGVRL
jgi:peptidoglycan/xylan/chitin deacetylase (PgdA/CDA1 family)